MPRLIRLRYYINKGRIKKKCYICHIRGGGVWCQANVTLGKKIKIWKTTSHFGPLKWDFGVEFGPSKVDFRDYMNFYVK